MLAAKLLTGIHVIAAGTFLAAGLFLDFVVLPHLRCLPPDQATKLARAVDRKFAAVSSGALGVLALTGVGQFAATGTWSRLMQAAFWHGGYGRALLCFVAIWTVLAILQGLYLTALAPRLPQGLPFDAFRAPAAPVPGALRATALARWTLRIQAVLGLAAMALGGVVRFGGFLG